MGKLKGIFGVILMVLGIVSGLYVGGWMMFVEPIIDACKAFDAGELTAMIMGITVLKCCFASTVGVIIGYIGIALGVALLNANKVKTFKNNTANE